MDNLNIIKGLVEKEKSFQNKRSYSIGRNEKCPCGSGKKFKKCCALNNPELSKETYFEKIKTADSEQEIISLLKEAVKNYPLEQSFVLPLIVYSLQNNYYQDAVKYLKHAWQLMGTDLDEAFISPLINILLDQEEIERAEKIVREALEVKGESIPLLIASAEVYKKEEKMQKVNDIIDRAMELDAENLQLIVFRLETLLDFDDVVSSLALFNKYYDQLKDYKQMRVIDFLDGFIEERFNLKENKELNKKEALTAAKKIFTAFEELDNLKLKSADSRGAELLGKIKDLPPKNSQIVLDILARYLAAELYEQFEQYAQEIEAVHKDNPNYLRLLFLNCYHQGELKKAYQNISKAFKIEKERKDGHFHNWQVAADYLQFIVDYGSNDDLKNFINDFNNLIEEDENLLANLMMLIENNRSEKYQNKLLNKILELLEQTENKNIKAKDVYNNLLFIKLAELDTKESYYDKVEAELIKDIELTINKIEAEGIDTPALSYAKLRLLDYQEEISAKEKKELLTALKNSAVESYFDTIAYYESILRFADPAPILTEIPHGKYLDDEYLDFYRLTAALKLGYYEIAAELFDHQFLKQSQENKLLSFFIRLLRYFEKEVLLEHLKKMQVDKEILKYLNQLGNI